VIHARPYFLGSKVDAASVSLGLAGSAMPAGEQGFGGSGDDAVEGFVFTHGVQEVTQRPRSRCQRSIRETGLVELSILRLLGARQRRCALGEFLPGKYASAVGY
jgi:hypothetical protein